MLTDIHSTVALLFHYHYLWEYPILYIEGLWFDLPAELEFSFNIDLAHNIKIPMLKLQTRSMLKINLTFMPSNHKWVRSLWLLALQLTP